MSTVAITLPDGSTRQFDGPITGAELAADIGPGLAKAALAIKIDDEVIDLSRIIDRDSTVEIITRKSDDALELIRHDAAHVMAQADQELFPETQVTIGPTIDHGFYYDFARQEPFSAEDLHAIEERMREIVRRDLPITREVWDRQTAKAAFADLSEHYKVEIIEEIIPEDEEVSIYRPGD